MRYPAIPCAPREGVGQESVTPYVVALAMRITSERSGAASALAPGAAAPGAAAAIAGRAAGGPAPESGKAGTLRASTFAGEPPIPNVPFFRGVYVTSMEGALALSAPLASGKSS